MYISSSSLYHLEIPQPSRATVDKYHPAIYQYCHNATLVYLVYCHCYLSHRSSHPSAEEVADTQVVHGRLHNERESIHSCLQHSLPVVFCDVTEENTTNSPELTTQSSKLYQ